MYGNLKIFGPARSAFDEYAHHLRTMLEPILPYDGIPLAVPAVAHPGVARRTSTPRSTLWNRANGARERRYCGDVRPARPPASSKAMRWGGVTLLALPRLPPDPVHDRKVNFNVGVRATRTIGESPYQLVVASFQVWWVVADLPDRAGRARAAPAPRRVERRSRPSGWTNTAAGPRPAPRRPAMVVAARRRRRLRPAAARSSCSASSSKGLDRLMTDDLIDGLYREGAPITDTKAPGGPDRDSAGPSASSRRSWSTRPTAAS